MSWSRRVKNLGTAVVTALLAGALSLLAVSQIHRPDRTAGKFVLAASTGFTITGSIEAWPSCSGTAVKFYPGQPDCLVYAVSNPLQAPISVTNLSAVVSATSPSTLAATCPASLLDLTGGAFNGTPFTVPAGGSAASVGVKIEMADNGNQTKCEGVTVPLTFTGTAQYTDTTSTVLTSSSNPSAVGGTVQLTASVTANDSSADTSSTDKAGPVPDGTVTFYQCTTSACTTKTPVATVGLTVGASSATATTATAALAVQGSFYYQASYMPAGAHSSDFATSGSNVVTQIAQGATCLNIATTGSGVTTITGTYNGNESVGSGKTLWLDGGTINGNVTITSGGSFVTSGGNVNGNVQSTGGSVALQGTTVSGHVQSTNGSVGLGPNTVVNGDLQPTGGSVFCAAGGSPGPIKISGNLQVQSMTAGSASVCGTAVDGNFQYQTNAAALVLGGSSGCPGDSVGGNLQVQSNSGKVTIGAVGYGNSANGNIQVQSNTGAGALTANSAGGNCQLQNDKPGIVGTSNTAKGNNTCNTGSGGA